MRKNKKRSFNLSQNLLRFKIRKIAKKKNFFFLDFSLINLFLFLKNFLQH